MIREKLYQDTYKMWDEIYIINEYYHRSRFFCCEKEEEINIYIFGALKSLRKKLITQFYINLKAPKTPHNNQQKKMEN